MSDPKNSLETVVQAAIDTSLTEVHTMLPGLVVSFDSDTQLADVQPTIKRKIKGKMENLPLLTDVPVRYSKSKIFSFTFPLEKGDQVLLIFSERSIDTWLTYGANQDPADVRQHSLSDAFAIPMMYDQTNIIANFNSDNLEIRGPNGIIISVNASGKATIINDADNLKKILDSFVTAVQNLDTFGSPARHSVHPSSQAVLADVKARLDRLME